MGLLLTLLMVFTLAACSSNEKTDQTSKNDGNNEQPAAAPAPVDSKEPDTKEVTPTGNVVEVTINAKNFEFDVKEIKAKVGDTVKIHFVNTEGGHGLALDKYNVDAKDGDTVEFMAAEAGEFAYYCSIMCGHGHDLMEGKLIVE